MKKLRRDLSNLHYDAKWSSTGNSADRLVLVFVLVVWSLLVLWVMQESLIFGSILALFIVPFWPVIYYTLFFKGPHQALYEEGIRVYETFIPWHEISSLTYFPSSYKPGPEVGGPRITVKTEEKSYSFIVQREQEEQFHKAMKSIEPAQSLMVDALHQTKKYYGSWKHKIAVILLVALMLILLAAMVDMTFSLFK